MTYLEQRRKRQLIINISKKSKWKSFNFKQKCPIQCKSKIGQSNRKLWLFTIRFQVYGSIDWTGGTSIRYYNMFTLRYVELCRGQNFGLHGLDSCCKTVDKMNAPTILMGKKVSTVLARKKYFEYSLNVKPRSYGALSHGHVLHAACIVVYMYVSCSIWHDNHWPACSHIHCALRWPDIKLCHSHDGGD